MNLWSRLEYITKLRKTKDYALFVIPMKLKMKFTFSAIAQSIQNLEINFLLKYEVISVIFSSYLTRTWWLKRAMNSEDIYLN